MNSYADKREVAELTASLDSINGELTKILKDSADHESEINMLRHQWHQDTNVKSALILQLRSSLENEKKEREQLVQEVR